MALLSERKKKQGSACLDGSLERGMAAYREYGDFVSGVLCAKTIHLVAYCFVFFWRSLGLKVYE